MTDENLRKSPWSPRSLLTVGILLAVAFLGGFLWQWIAARDARTQRDDIRLELTFEELENQLAAAVIHAENDSYEGARELMSRFFTDLQASIDQAPEGARGQLEGLLSQRDAVITTLSRSAPESDDVLTRLFTRYQVAMGGPEVGIPIPAAGAADTATRGAPGDTTRRALPGGGPG